MRRLCAGIQELGQGGFCVSDACLAIGFLVQFEQHFKLGVCEVGGHFLRELLAQLVFIIWIFLAQSLDLPESMERRGEYFGQQVEYRFIHTPGQEV